MSKVLVVGAMIGAFLVGPGQRPAAAQRNSGESTVCGEFAVLVINAGIFGSLEITAPDEGWAYVDPARKRRQATGIATDVHVAAEDTPANHYSHDLDFKVDLDPGQEDLLSIQPDDHMPVEWESGIRPWEHSGSGANPIFPMWAWPSPGDRLWVEGNWIHDCGHPDDDTGLYKTEIHPARAIATTRLKAAPLPGTGLAPVEVTQTDVYISGKGGFTPNQLNCGPDIILGPYGGTCGQDPPPTDDSYKTTPINDTDFTFYVCVPRKSSFYASLIYRVDDGPGNTVGIPPLIDKVPASSYCATDENYDHSTMLSVTIPLKDTTTVPTSVYARRVYAGWLATRDPVIPHRRLTVESTDLHEDHDLDPGDGELTFWWFNLNYGGAGLPGSGADSPWIRLADYADGNMNDYDDDTGPGDGEMTYTGAAFDFYAPPFRHFTVGSVGYEQDCFDNSFDGFWFTHRRLEFGMYALCYADFEDAGAGDPLGTSLVYVYPEELGSHTIRDVSTDYHIRFRLEDVPIAAEDTSYLSIQTGCTPPGEVALVGQPLTCETRVSNAGTGLPRQVTIRNQFPDDPTTTLVSPTTWSLRAPFGDGTSWGCADLLHETFCQPVIVPVAVNAPVVMTAAAIPDNAGPFTERAEVTTVSNDPDLSNNVAVATVDVFRSITIDVAPRDASNVINLSRGGAVAAAILTTDDFDASTADPLSACFGDAGAPAERTCTELHATGHLEDVNKDKRPDLLLHFDLGSTGIDPGDTSACLRARTRDGIGLYACDTIVVQ